MCGPGITVILVIRRCDVITHNNALPTEVPKITSFGCLGVQEYLNLEFILD
uniref:Uncharacterized protein n=1 Tax=Heterorhabditis bacteriophora TaxID=37862 RepID=A0A1I7WB37_HETBA